jgi:hypothetical protein
MSKYTGRPIVLVLCALVFYSLGASFLQRYVIYPTWPLIGVEAFRAYHAEYTSRIFLYLVWPWIVEIGLTVLLFWRRPRAISRWVVLMALALNMMALGFAALIQGPIQLELGRNGLTADRFEKLIATDWLRRSPLTIKAILYLWVMSRLMSPVDSSATRAEKKPLFSEHLTRIARRNDRERQI